MTMSKIANKNPGTALPKITMLEVQTSNLEPSLVAFEMPSGIEIK